MLRIVCITLLFCWFFASQPAIGSEVENDSVPKIGLTLCGGGAKGFAEIGVLKVLEEIDFPVDYIAGNSIGSIVGAFYAMGYSADTMEAIVRAQNWEELMVDKVDRANQPLLQRHEDARYSLSVPFNKDGFAFPTGIFEGQNIMRLFSDLSIGYHGNIDFNQLPTPFRCVATDVVYGEEVILQSGSLVNAIRASMAVPGAFTPVDWEDYLLLDGMMVNNYPVDICKEMGADYIIGIDIQGELAQKQDIKSLGDIMGNMTSWMAQSKYVDNVDLTDFYIRPAIDDYSGADFDDASLDSLIRIGEEAARAVLPELIRVRDSLGLKSANRLKPVKRCPKLDDSYYISSVSLSGSIRTNKNEIFRRLGIEPGAQITLREIHAGVDRIYGTKYFKYVKYNLIEDEEGNYKLILDLKEKKTDRVNVGIHYDTYNDAALLLNTTFTGRSTWGSRLSLDVRLSQNLAFAAEYGMDRGKKPALGTDLVISDYKVPYYEDGDEVGNLDLIYYNFGANLHGNLYDNALIGFKVDAEYFDIQKVRNFPTLNPLENRFFLSYSAFVEFDNQDSYNFPTRGGKVDASYIFTSRYGNVFEYDHRINTFNLQARWAFSLSKRFVWQPGVYARYIWGDQLEPYYLSVVGGEEWTDYFDRQLPFIGLDLKEGVFQHGTVVRSDFRVRLWEKHYITLKTNYGHLWNSDGVSVFGEPDFEDDHYLIFGGGLTYSYDSPIGPLEITMSGSNYRDGANSFINLGYWF